MKAFIEYFDDKRAEEIAISGIHSSKDGIRIILDDDLPFSEDRFFNYEELQKVTIYDLKA